MYEDDLLDFKRMPWSNPGYRDTEDESKLPETEVHITICPFNHSFISPYTDRRWWIRPNCECFHGLQTTIFRVSIDAS